MTHFHSSFRAIEVVACGSAPFRRVSSRFAPQQRGPRRCSDDVGRIANLANFAGSPLPAAGRPCVASSCSQECVASAGLLHRLAGIHHSAAGKAALLAFRPACCEAEGRATAVPSGCTQGSQPGRRNARPLVSRGRAFSLECARYASPPFPVSGPGPRFRLRGLVVISPLCRLPQ